MNLDVYPLIAPIVAVATLAFGLMIGSFLNVVIYRVPNGMSVVSPPSACPDCGSGIKSYDNVPVVSWLVLHGRCRSCNGKISSRYPLVEGAVGVFFLAVGGWWWAVDGRFATGGTDFAADLLILIAMLWLAASSVALALIDLDTHTLPNSIVFSSYVAGGTLLAAAGVLNSDVDALIRAVIGMAALWLAYFLMAMLYPGGMGFGDVKLAGVLGLYLGFAGWGSLLVGAFAAFLLGGVFAIGLVIFKKANRKSGIPFGPWMLGGAWIGIFAGDKLWTSYLSLLGVA